jgi:2,3-bisphosphoglycerate-independent phosphoglycerate mutase
MVPAELNARRPTVKYLFLIGDGMADFPLDELNGRTPLEVAFTPSMDEVATNGQLGLFCPIPDGLPPGSDIGNLSLFGFNPRETFSGRAPLEAANQGITLRPDQVAFRCNLVCIRDGVMVDFTSGHISTEEASALIAALKTHFAHAPVFFSPGVSYRHITIVTAQDVSVDDLVALSCTPPHDITGQAVDEYLPKGAAQEFVRGLMDASRPVLADHPTNLARIQAGKLPATTIWLWGQGRAPAIPSYRSKYGLTGAVISAVDLVKGIGACAGLEAVNVPGATGYLDTNYKGKVSAALECLRRHDFVYLHVEAPDETSHEGKLPLKIKAIEDFDANVVAPCLEYARNHPNVRLLVAPDHVTSLKIKTHAPGPVPFAIQGPGIAAGAGKSYSEAAAKETGVYLSEGYTLVSHVLQAREITAESLNGQNK